MGLALVAVIAVSIVGTVLVLRSDSGGGNGSTPSAQNGDSEFASANDLGPANIITEDPTCDAWGKVARGLADKLKSIGWDDRDTTVSADSWTPGQRAMFENASKIMDEAAGQTRNLVKLTPHRVMRELYQQFIAYNSAFVSRIPTYSAGDNGNVLVMNALGTATSNVCSAIDYRSAQPVAPLVSEPKAPTAAPHEPVSNESQLFLTDTNPICKEWSDVADEYSDKTAAWRALDPNTPGSAWTSEERAINDAVGPIMLKNADAIERLGRQSENPTLEDFATLAAQYRRGYVATLSSYTDVDNFLAESAAQLVGSVYWACKAVPR
ncbi:hypothetical protein [Mycobacterium syngnathidarum]|uniref:hypothetical protein n=1 Tax=Mycobacterium syngnathidarum TaxID=1908205 RepID=UPI001A96D284|nr:hypothetical protein [Mycobacterium syngnathidarum]